MISVLALKDLYLKYGNDEEKQRSITYGNVISVRDFTDNDAVKIKDNMGIYIMNMMNKYSSERNGSQSISSERFWNLVQSDSEFITKNIQSKNIFCTPSFEDNHNSELPFYDLFLTNVGNIETSKFNIMHQNLMFSIVGGLSNIENYLLYLVSYSIHNKLYIRIFYNSHHIHEEFITDFINQFQNIFKKFSY
jgi:hypothetical protein